jgi:hypothetical protein
MNPAPFHREAYLELTGLQPVRSSRARSIRSLLLAPPSSPLCIPPRTSHRITFVHRNRPMSGSPRPLIGVVRSRRNRISHGNLRPARDIVPAVLLREYWDRQPVPTFPTECDDHSRRLINHGRWSLSPITQRGWSFQNTVLNASNRVMIALPRPQDARKTSEPKLEHRQGNPPCPKVQNSG